MQVQSRIGSKLVLEFEFETEKEGMRKIRRKEVGLLLLKLIMGRMGLIVALLGNFEIHRMRI
jgi:hypothetical protein